MIFKNGEVVERFVGVQPKSRLQASDRRGQGLTPLRELAHTNQ